MNGNEFGRLFRVTTFGESHGEAMGVTVSGCPAGLELDEDDVQRELDRRKPGQSQITTSRGEPDAVSIKSGLQDGYTTGTPIGMVIQNKDARSGKYEPFITAPRPSHGDFTYSAKFGTRNWGGGGRSSARETANWVAAGAIAKQILASQGVEIRAHVNQIGDIEAPEVSFEEIREHADENPSGCPPRDGRTDARGDRRVPARGRLDRRVDLLRDPGRAAGTRRAALRFDPRTPRPGHAERPGRVEFRVRPGSGGARLHGQRAQRGLEIRRARGAKRLGGASGERSDP